MRRLRTRSARAQSKGSCLRSWRINRLILSRRDLGAGQTYSRPDREIGLTVLGPRVSVVTDVTRDAGSVTVRKIVRGGPASNSRQLRLNEHRSSNLTRCCRYASHRRSRERLYRSIRAGRLSRGQYRRKFARYYRNDNRGRGRLRLRHIGGQDACRQCGGDEYGLGSASYCISSVDRRVSYYPSALPGTVLVT